MSRAFKNALYRAGLAVTVLLQLVAAQAQPAAPEALLSHLADIEALEGTFQQTRHIAVLAIPLHSSGNFHYRRDEGIVWRTLEPITNEIRITREQGIVAFDPAGTARTLPASEVVAGIFLNLFAGELDSLRDYFDIDILEATDSADVAPLPAAGQPSWRLRLTATLPALSSQIEYILVSGREHVERVVIQDANGDRSELSLDLARAVENQRP